METIKKNQSEIKDTLTEMNNLQGSNRRLNEPKNQISDLEYKEPKNPHLIRTAKRKKNPALTGVTQLTGPHSTK